MTSHIRLDTVLPYYMARDKHKHMSNINECHTLSMCEAIFKDVMTFICNERTEQKQTLIPYQVSLKIVNKIKYQTVLTEMICSTVYIE